MTAPLDAVRSAVALVCGVDPAELDAATDLAALGADSLALVSIADVVEADLGTAGVALHIDDASLGRMRRLGDIVEYVVAHGGVLSEA